MAISTVNKPLLHDLQQMGILSATATPQLQTTNFDQTPAQTLAKIKTEVFDGDGTGVKYALDYPYPSTVVSCLAYPQDGTAGGKNIKLLTVNVDYKLTDGSNFKNILDNSAYRIALTYISN